MNKKELLLCVPLSIATTRSRLRSATRSLPPYPGEALIRVLRAGICNTDLGNLMDIIGISNGKLWQIYL
jgi:D-arabinose 1-dehydrogenase-like Zn-dependent alcohol dehydrogenase